MKIFRLLIYNILLLLCSNIAAQTTYHFDIDWQEHDPEPLSCYTQRISLNDNQVKANAEIKNIKSIDCESSDNYDFITNYDIKFKCGYGCYNGKSVCDISIIPYYLDSITNQPKLVVSFDVTITTKPKERMALSKDDNASILKTGSWYKFNVYESGIYTLTASDLEEIGINTDNLNTSSIKIHAKKGFVLNETIGSTFAENPPQIPIIVKDYNNDNIFNDEDQIIFYIEGPHAWSYDTLKIVYYLNYNHYTDTASFFLTINDFEEQKLMPSNTEYPEFAGEILNVTQKKFFKEEFENLAESGRQWVGEKFSYPDSIYRVPCYFEVNEVSDDMAAHSHVKFTVAVNSNSTSTLYPLINGVSPGTSKIRISRVIDAHNRANEKSGTFDFKCLTKKTYVDIVLSNESTQWECWNCGVETNLRSKLTYIGEQFAFSDPYSGNEAIVRFSISQSPDNLQVMNITNPVSPVRINRLDGFENFTFDYRNSSYAPEEFIAYDDNNLLKPVFAGRVENQDLLSSPLNIDYLVLTPQCLYSEAEWFAQFHEKYDGYTYKIATIEQIFNEYTCGQQDMTAIREYIRRIYEKTNHKYPRFVQIIGGTSYDYKNIAIETKNMFPTFECDESFDETDSFGSDDYFVIMDYGEGFDGEGIPDIPLGRLPFDKHEELERMYDKISHYVTTRSNPDGLWRHRYVLSADDDSRTYLKYMEEAGKKIDDRDKLLISNKVYLDAFKQERTLTGQSSPEATKALVNAFNNGALFISYFGHGSKLGWAAENLLNVPAIQQIDNYDRMPIIVASTCEFFQFDSPGLTPAGLQLLGHSKGGTISIISTSRLSLTDINKQFLQHYTDYINADSLRNDASIGKIFLSGKQLESTYSRNILLFGDPALKLNYPDFQAVIDTINGLPASEFFNSGNEISALELMNFKGSIMNRDRQQTMNGYLEYQLFDKPSEYYTLNNEGAGTNYYTVYDDILVRGKAKISDGKFEISFRMPQDLSHSDGSLKLDMYAYDTIIENVAGGCLTGLYTSDETDSFSDNEGPKVTGYINSRLFENNDIVPKQSVLYLHIEDESGISCTDRIIGKDIYLTIDNNGTKVVLNSYFTPTADDYKQGDVKYPMPTLETGDYTATVRVYDLCDNYTDLSLNFKVADKVIPKIAEVRNEPNPVSSHTDFRFIHNMSGNKVSVNIEIFDSNFKLVKVIKRENVTCIAGNDIVIHCSSSELGGLANGLYAYRMTVTSETGHHVSASSKMLISN